MYSACTRDLTYRGCFTNEAGDRVDAIEDGHEKTIEECASLAEEMGSLYFGMEWPEDYGRENAAECLILPSIPKSAQKVCDDECASEIDGNSRQLGGNDRLAVYELEGDSEGA